MTKRVACGCSLQDRRRRETTVDSGSMARITVLATGSAAALDPPQWLRPAHAGLTGRGGEDHPAGGRLQHGRDDHANGLVHVAPAVLDDDHGAVVEVGHPLILLFAFFDHLDVHLFPRDDDWLQCVGQVVEVEDPNSLELRDPVEVVVIGHDGGVPLRGQLDQLHVDLSNVGYVFVDKVDVYQGVLLQHVEHLEPPPSPVSPQRVTGVGDVLQLGEDEMRHQDLVPQKTGLRDVHNAPVDDDAGVEKHAGGRRVGGEGAGGAG